MTKYILLNRFYRSDWIFKSQLRFVALAFEDYLRERLYTERTVRSYLKALAHFAYWFKSKKLAISDIDERVCEAFVIDHLPRCGCPDPCLREALEARPALSHLRTILVEQGFCAEKPEPFPFVSNELRLYQVYLANTCGIALGTSKNRLKIIRPFLQSAFGKSQIDLSKLSSHDLDKFVLSFSGRQAASSLGTVRTALRSYLRYRAIQGDSTETLSISLPLIANLRGPKLPRTLTAEQLKLLLGAFDRKDQRSIRGYAIVRCLLDLGLRGHEVTELLVGSINWREGTVSIRTSKGRQVKQLPLPAETGAAIASYLKKVRPRTNCPALFVNEIGRSPRPFQVSGIRRIIKQAFVRCGLADQFCGLHIFRHTLAVRLVQSGSSLKEIADVLRHKSLESTTHYAKVNLEALRLVALPWPGSKS